MIQFDEKIYFYLLAIIPVMALAFFFLQIWKKKTQKRFADSSLLKRLAFVKLNHSLNKTFKDGVSQCPFQQQ